MKRIKPPQIILAAVVVVLALLVVPQFVMERAGSRSVSADAISLVIGMGDTNSSADFQVKLLEGSDAEHESTHIFQPLVGVQGIGKAELNAESLVLTVTFDDAVIDEDTIRGKLVEAGYLVATAADYTKTMLDEDGATQRIAINDDGAHFDPTMILAQAGIPLTMEFAPGKECRVSVKLPELGVEQDISSGGTVELPALDAGEYEIVCSQDGHEGVLVVE
jgi:copper chaperone CopZ